MKIVINDTWGGFNLSKKALEMLNEEDDWKYRIDDVMRTDPELVKVVETLGEEANGEYAELYIVEIPEEATDWKILEYDGTEDVIYVLNGKMRYAN